MRVSKIRVMKTVLTVVLVAIMLGICFFSTTILLSYIYGLDETLITF